jgi:hypothetical protein
MRGLFTLIIATIAALVGGVIGFQLGVTSNIGAAGGTVVWHAGFGFFGFFFPFLFFFLFLGLVFAAFGGRRRGWGGGPGWGYGHGPNGYGDDARRQWIADAHRKLHEDEARTGGTTPSSGGPTAG